MNIKCVLNVSQKKNQYNPHDVYFKIDGKTINSSLTHMDRNSLILKSTTTLEMDHKYVECFIKKRKVDSAHIQVGCKYRITELDKVSSKSTIVQ